MSGGGLVEVLDLHRYVARTQADTSGCRGCRWAFKWANTETARSAHAAHLADVVTAHLAARLEGCGSELYDVIGNATEMWGEWSDDASTAVRAVIRESVLGLEPPSDALGGASDGRTGRDGTSMQGERVGDGL